MTSKQSGPSDDKTNILADVKNEDYCYLTTTGRVSGKLHEIEIWFGTQGTNTLYLLAGSGEDSDWVKNLSKNPNVTVRIGKQTFNGMAHIVHDELEELMARHLVARKYQGWEDGQPLSEWGRTALVIAVILDKN